MKNALKITGKILLGILILIIVSLLILFIYNRIMLGKEDELLKGYPGQPVDVNGHCMNVYAGGEGEHTLVFLAGASDCSPVISFRPLCGSLDDDCKTVVIEKFGYGMSDVVDGKREYPAMVDECREALSKAGIGAPYILCPYSKSGLDALIWAQSYPDEVEAVIGIDMAFPKSYDKIDTDRNDSTGMIGVLRNMGIARLFTAGRILPDTYTQEENDMLAALVNRKYSNKAMFNEILTVPGAVELINSRPAPACPMHLFLSNGGGTGMDEQAWRGCAYRYTEGLDDITYTELDCGHGEIIYKETDRIISDIREFIGSPD